MKVNFFIPKYMKEFNCIGSDCNDTCCAGWDINIDETTFNKYKNSSEKLKKLVDGKFTKSKSLDDSFNYGFMNINDNKCPFLNENLLCDIHGNCGEENLSITCKRYPRVFNIVDDIYEKSGIPSCEEVCKKAFLNKNKLEFTEISEELDESSIEIRRIIDSEAFYGSSSLLQYFWDIRIISINIIQNRAFTIEERLNILNYFYSSIETLKDEYDFEKIEVLISDFSDSLIDLNSLKGLPFEYSANFYSSILSNDLISNIRGVRLKNLLLPLKENILACNESIIITDTLLKPYSYIFENFLTNQIFKDIIPFNKGENLKASFNTIYNTYNLIKYYIILLNKFSNMDLNEDLFIRVIQSLSKDTEHNKVFKSILDNAY